jgi:DNA-binding PadR family transcriptional regulator
MNELSATGRAILGMLALGKQTGYDIKQLVDKATRHFWAASYGQIYPELRRLELAGLVTGRSEPAGGRARQVYDLTESGHELLREWLVSPHEPLFELRCESLLKLFFSDAVGPETRLDILRRFRELTERKLEQLQAIGTPVHEGPRLSLEFGLAMNEFMIDWCREAEARLTAEREGV